MNDRERRVGHGTEVRVVDEVTGRFEAVVVQYGVLDDYGTIFDPGCFRESLEARMPRITWAHDWSEPLGRYVGYQDTEQSLTLIGQFDSFDDVPRARQAWAQLRSGTIDQFSVGFVRREVADVEGVTHFVKAQLDEAALVLVGAVPDTKLVSVRSPAGVSEVPVDFVIDLARKKAAGMITQAEAEEALALVATTPPPEQESPVVDEAVALAQAEADVILNQINDGSL